MASTATAHHGQSNPTNRHTDVLTVSAFTALLAALAALGPQLLTTFRQWVVGLANDYAEQQYGVRPYANPDAHMGIMREVQLIGGAVIMIAVITLVVNEVLSVDAIANQSGPFTGVIGSLETTGVAAMTLLVVGLLVVAAMALMRYFNQWG